MTANEYNSEHMHPFMQQQQQEFVDRIKFEMERCVANSATTNEEDLPMLNEITTNNDDNNNDHSRCDSDDSQAGGDSDSNDVPANNLSTNSSAGGERRFRGSGGRRVVERRKLSPVSDENAGIGPSSTWSPLQLQQQLFDQTWATVNNHLSNQGLSSKTSDSSSHSINSSTNSKSKRANRTRFSDRQVKVLQDFFETNAYPKDDDLECLSKQLGLSPRVIVVWFQNARQKARKVYENRPTSASMSEADDDNDSIHHHAQSRHADGGLGVGGGSQGIGNNSHLNVLRMGDPNLASPMSQGDGESSMGGLHSPSGSTAEFNSSGGSGQHNNNLMNNQHHLHHNHQQQQQNQIHQHQLDNLFLNHLDNESNRGEDEDAEGHDEHDDEEEDDDDEFMSAAQMMRHQQQQRQQQQQQQQHQHQQHHQQQQNQHLHQNQQSQQFAAAAAAAGLFGSDASNLLSLIAANQQAVGSNNLLGADLHQRNMMEALNSAMRGAVQSVNNGNLMTSNAGGGGNNNNNNNSNNSISGNSNHNNSLNLNEGSNASLGATSNLSDRNTSSSASQRDKRLRTQISPEQLDYLYQKYQVESNPSRKTLESIAQDVGLSKRVVQVWFQNTRARERRGQLRMSHVVAQQQRNISSHNNNNNNHPTVGNPTSGQATSAGIQGVNNKLAVQQNGNGNLQQTVGGSVVGGQQQNGDLNAVGSVAGQDTEKDENGNGGGAVAAAAAAAAAAQLANLTGSNAAAAAAMAALMRGQLLDGTPGFAPLDLSGSKALFAGLNQLSALGVNLNFDPQQQPH